MMRRSQQKICEGKRKRTRDSKGKKGEEEREGKKCGKPGI